MTSLFQRDISGERLDRLVPVLGLQVFAGLALSTKEVFARKCKAQDQRGILAEDQSVLLSDTDKPLITENVI